MKIDIKPWVPPIVREGDRFITLHDAGLVTIDDPIELVRDLVAHSKKLARHDQTLIENAKLRNQLAVVEHQLSEANARTRAVEHVNVQLEEQLKQHAQRQTHVRLEVNTMKQGEAKAVVEAEFGTDQLSDPSFTPCRDERCSRTTLHAAHSTANVRGPRRKKDSHA